MPAKRKRGAPDIKEILERPWCYYCERDFDDLKILISHQKAKHFKCEKCGRRLNTIGGLSVHMTQVHKESLTGVENAMHTRSDIGPEIFGMEGIPEEIMGAHIQRITEAYFKMDMDRRALTGNPGPGGKGGEGSANKKPKMETPEEIKKRLAEHKAKKAAEKLGLGSGGSTPADGNAADGVSGNLATNNQYYHAYGRMQPPTDDFSHPYNAPYQQTHAPWPSKNPSPYPGFNPNQPPPQQGYPPYAGSPLNGPQFHSPVTPWPSKNFQQPYPQPPQNQYSPQGPPQQSHFAPGPPHQNFQSGPHPYHQPQHSGPSRPRSGGGPPPNAPGMNPGLPAPAPGLPQRPSFGVPNINKEEMARMHSGQGVQPVPQYGIHNPYPAPPPRGAHSGHAPDRRMSNHNNNHHNVTGDAVDDLINSVTSGAAQQVKKEPVINTEPHQDVEMYRGSPEPVSYAEATAQAIKIAPWPKGDQRRVTHPMFRKQVSPDKNESTPVTIDQFGATAKPSTASSNDHAASKDVEMADVAAPAAATIEPEPVAEKQAATAAPIAEKQATVTAPPTTKPVAKKATKGKKVKPIDNRVYAENVITPEEKMASKARYAFDRNASVKTEFVQGDVTGAVTGIMGEDVVRDPTETAI
ncbi:hypothetical protein LTR17_020367 [Elasticomyces elasticus]|nr:hypothetical protein LTR17_020367 [Elasticomyces elasticus]